MADFDGYINTFKGTVISSESDFDNAAARVNALLKSFTEGRIDDYTDDCKDTAVYVMTEEAYKAAKETKASAVHAGIASENNDGYIVSYAASGSRSYAANEQETEAKLYKTARMYLPAYLFYRGVVL